MHHYDNYKELWRTDLFMGVSENSALALDTQEKVRTPKDA